MCLSDLTLQTPKRAKWAPQNTFKQHLKPLVYSTFCDLGPFFVQIGAILSNTLGHLMKGLLWIGPKSPKIESKILSNTLFCSV